MLVVVIVSLATAAPVPGYKNGSDPNAEAQRSLHRNIKKEYGNEKAFAAKNPSAAVKAPAVVPAMKPIGVAPDRKCPPPKQMDPKGNCREPWGR